MNEENKKTIVSEIKFVVDNMEKSATINEKLYYFSAVHAMIQRIFNMDYNEDVLYIFYILNDTYNCFMQRISSMQRGDSVIQITNEQIERLQKLTKELGVKLNKGENIDNLMKQFVLLSYSTTGNGFYLLKKGKLSFG